MNASGVPLPLTETQLSLAMLLHAALLHGPPGKWHFLSVASVTFTVLPCFVVRTNVVSLPPLQPLTWPNQAWRLSPAAAFSASGGPPCGWTCSILGPLAAGVGFPSGGSAEAMPTLATSSPVTTRATTRTAISFFIASYLLEFVVRNP